MLGTTSLLTLKVHYVVLHLRCQNTFSSFLIVFFFFLQPTTPLSLSISDSLCSFWNNTLQGWSQSGCRLVEASEEFTKCQCDHLTNFGVIMDINGNLEDSVRPICHPFAFSGTSQVNFAPGVRNLQFCNCTEVKHFPRFQPNLIE